MHMKKGRVVAIAVALMAIATAMWTRSAADARGVLVLGPVGVVRGQHALVNVANLGADGRCRAAIRAVDVAGATTSMETVTLTPHSIFTKVVEVGAAESSERQALSVGIAVSDAYRCPVSTSLELTAPDSPADKAVIGGFNPQPDPPGKVFGPVGFARGQHGIVDIQSLSSDPACWAHIGVFDARGARVSSETVELRPGGIASKAVEVGAAESSERTAVIVVVNVSDERRCPTSSSLQIGDPNISGVVIIGGTVA